MRTYHRIIFGNSDNMKEIKNESVNLIVTSPPYPMIEMWDDLFSSLNPKIKEALGSGEGFEAYDLIHEELNKVWKEVDRVLIPGGIACINIGDATRKLNGSFQLYANHSKITNCFEKLNFQVLPLILWRKETNKPNKYMGSGMLPPNAYVTLEHEYILIFRKGCNRDFKSDEKLIRQKSSFFWEERNVWFSDVWNNLKGISQNLNHKELRDRSAAYPFELAHRLINMYSVQGDTVLDPFLGTGTTTIAAMCSARDSVGYELDPNFKKIIDIRANEALDFSKKIIKERLKRHLEFVEKRQEEKGELKHMSNKYGFKVMTNQEKNIFFPITDKINKADENDFEVLYNKENPLNEIKLLKKEKKVDLSLYM